MKSQCDNLLSALQAGKKLTGFDIIHDLNILNYKGRISDLRSKGHNIHTNMIERPNGAKIAQYSLTGQTKLF